MLAVLVANGVLTDEAALRLRVAAADADLLVGVDGGTYHLLRLGLLPHAVTGDFDSLAETDRRRLAEQGVRVFPTPDQDYTDLDKAIAASLAEFGATKIRVFAATQGRLDHVFSVLSTIIKYGDRADLRLVDEDGETWLVRRSVTISDRTLPGRTLSLLAMGRVEGITLTGVRWPLTGESLEPGVRDGTLNLVTEETVSLSVTSGPLLLMLHWPPRTEGSARVADGDGASGDML
ncbi:MAG: thiamine diphosphokinase [Capsulimonadales bacterium]|nr:thiamine diphosphokinase [Capsulimonadales bacterium]